MLHPQYFYNIFITNHRRLVVISSNLNLTLRLLFCPNQWRLQEFCPRCSYSTLKKFRVISVCFGKYRPKFKIWPAWSLCLKKKKVLKTETNLHFVYRKPQKEKKMKRKEMNKGTCIINYKLIWNINKIINYCCLVVSLICLSFINYNLLYCYFINY